MAIKFKNVKIILRRVTDSERTSIVFDDGEPIYCTNTRKFYLGDGQTLGGRELVSGTIIKKGSPDEHGIVKLSAPDIDNMAFSNSDTRITLYSDHISANSGNPHGVTTQMIGAQPILGYIAENVDKKGVANGYAGLDLSGKVPLDQLPVLGKLDVFTVNDELSMIRLPAKKGDICVNVAYNKTYILRNDPALTISNWVQVLTPGSGGNVVTLLSELNDTQVESALPHQVLAYEGGKWINKSITPADIGAQPTLTYIPENNLNKDKPGGYAGLDNYSKLSYDVLPPGITPIDYHPEDLAMKDQPSGYAGLDLNGKIKASQVPNTLINEVFTADSSAAMYALTAQKGDMCIRSDVSRTFVLSTDTNTFSGWVEIRTPIPTAELLMNLSDVSLTNLSVDQLLLFNGSKWENVNTSSIVTGGSSTLSGLTDITLNSPINSQALIYDNGNWINKTLNANDVNAEAIGAVSLHTSTFDHNNLHAHVAGPGLEMTQTNGTTSFAQTPSSTVQLVHISTDSGHVGTRSNIKFKNTASATFSVNDNISGDLVEVSVNTTGIGTQGPQGFAGVDGQQGVEGVTGQQGPQGFNGQQGSQGLAGVGTQGPQGVNGINGTQGPQGPQGNDGAAASGSSFTKVLIPVAGVSTAKCFALASVPEGGSITITPYTFGEAGKTAPDKYVLNATTGVVIKTLSLYFEGGAITNTSPKVWIDYLTNTNNACFSAASNSTDISDLFIPQVQAWINDTTISAKSAATISLIGDTSTGKDVRIINVGGLTGNRGSWINISF